MSDLTSARWMYVKAVLLLLIGVASGLLLWLQAPSLKTAFLILLVAWSSARAYYFAFYVIEKYIDGQYRFSGLLDFVRYCWRKRATRPRG